MFLYVCQCLQVSGCQMLGAVELAETAGKSLACHFKLHARTEMSMCSGMLFIPVKLPISSLLDDPTMLRLRMMHILLISVAWLSSDQ